MRSPQTDRLLEQTLSCLFAVHANVQRLLFACYSGDELRPHTLIVNSLLALIPSG